MEEAENGVAGPTGLDEEAGQYEITLDALVFPIPIHLAFNVVSALSILLVGHPWLAMGTVALATVSDIAQQMLVRRWKQTARQVEERAGMTRIAALCAVRMTVGLTPLALMVVQGGLAELLLASTMVLSMFAIGQAVGSLSRRVFWAYTVPVLAAIALLVALRLPAEAAAGVLLALASCTVVMWMLSYNTSRVIMAWQAEYEAKKAANAELLAARDEARRANRAKSNFLATMSHEIRTPMNGVLGMAQLLRRDETEELQKQRLDVLIDSGEYLLSILNDILDVSKVDAGRLEIVPAPEDMRQFFERLVGFWGARADEGGIALSLRLDEGVPPYGLVDALRLRQVMFNLVGNALKFTDEGQVELSAAAVPTGDDAVLLHIAVRDTGPGIAEEHLPALFSRFSQADESEVRRFGGTGLGLAIAKQLVELMDGRIWAESQLGEGSTFHVELPMPVAGAPVEEASMATAPTGDIGGLKVLAVDDNAVNVLVLDQLLTSLGCAVSSAASGAEALEALECETFDLVLMDIQMPGMTGIEALERLRQGNGPNRAAPVIALTADVTSGGRNRYLGLGFDEHTTKPIQIEDLLAAMERATAKDTRAERAA